MLTDTIYGVLGNALKKDTVERIYEIKKRRKDKPTIVLISSVNDLSLFGIKVDKNTKKDLLTKWPGKVSIIMPCIQKKFSYLHRGKKSLAFRLPKDRELLTLLEKTGPLVAPSANTEGLPPADTIKQAQKYFGDKVDFYIDKGAQKGTPSKIFLYKDGEFISVRK